MVYCVRLYSVSLRYWPLLVRLADLDRLRTAGSSTMPISLRSFSTFGRPTRPVDTNLTRL